MHLKTSKEHLKLFIYFENKIFPSDTLIIQETHSAKEDDIKWKDEFGGIFIFSHRGTNSCGGLISFPGNKTVTAKKYLSDENGRILILEMLFILINL